MRSLRVSIKAGQQKTKPTLAGDIVIVASVERALEETGLLGLRTRGDGAANELSESGGVVAVQA